MFYTRRTHKRTLHILRWTSAVRLQGAGCRSRSRECAFYKDASRAAYVLGPLPSRGGISQTRGWIQCVLVKIWRSTWNTYLVWRLLLLHKQEVKTFVSALHCSLENGADLYVNEHQNIRHYRTRSTEERKKKNAKC